MLLENGLAIPNQILKTVTYASARDSYHPVNISN
jgi:hypothetical protein